MKFNVLIVDDEKNIRQGLGKALEMDGHHIFLAEDGQEALDIIHEEEVDLVIADLRMPRLSGEELLRRVVDQWPTIPVIILTGHGSYKDEEQARRLGAFDYLKKPVGVDTLVKSIQKAYQQKIESAYAAEPSDEKQSPQNRH